MSFLSRRDSIFRKIIDRLELKQVLREPVTVPSTITPVIDITNLQDERYGETITGVATDRTDEFTVPKDRRWDVMLVQGDRSVAADTISIEIYEGKHGVSIFVKPVVAGKLLLWEPHKRMILEEGDIIRVAYATGTVGVVTSRIYVLEAILN